MQIRLGAHVALRVALAATHYVVGGLGFAVLQDEPENVARSKREPLLSRRSNTNAAARSASPFLSNRIRSSLHPPGAELAEKRSAWLQQAGQQRPRRSEDEYDPATQEAPPNDLVGSTAFLASAAPAVAPGDAGIEVEEDAPSRGQHSRQDRATRLFRRPVSMRMKMHASSHKDEHKKQSLFLQERSTRSEHFHDMFSTRQSRKNEKAQEGQHEHPPYHNYSWRKHKLKVNLATNVFALSAIAFAGWHGHGPHAESFDQYCVRADEDEDGERAVWTGMQECAGVDQSSTVAEQRKYAFAFRVLKDEGDAPEMSLTKKDKDGRAGGTLYPAPIERRGRGATIGGLKPSAPGVLIAPQEQVQDPSDSKGSGRDGIRCLTYAEGYSSDRIEEVVQEQHRPLPIVSRQVANASSCARWRWFPVPGFAQIDGIAILGYRNVWQLRLVMPAAEERKIGPLCLDSPLALFYRSLGVFPCLQGEGQRRCNEDRWCKGRWQLVRQQRWGLQKLDDTKFQSDGLLLTTKTVASTATAVTNVTSATSTRPPAPNEYVSTPSGVDNRTTASSAAGDSPKTRDDAEDGEASSRDHTDSEHDASAEEDESLIQHWRLGRRVLLVCIFVGAALCFGVLGWLCCCARDRSAPSPGGAGQEDEEDETESPGRENNLNARSRTRTRSNDTTGGAEESAQHMAAAGAGAKSVTPQTMLGTTPSKAASPSAMASDFWTAETQGRRADVINYSMESEMRDTPQPESGISAIGVAAPQSEMRDRPVRGISATAAAGPQNRKAKPLRKKSRRM